MRDLRKHFDIKNNVVKSMHEVITRRQKDLSLDLGRVIKGVVIETVL